MLAVNSKFVFKILFQGKIISILVPPLLTDTQLIDALKEDDDKKMIDHNYLYLIFPGHDLLTDSALAQ